MSQELLPVLAQRNDMRIVEVDGQPVVTARDLARALGYSHIDKAVVNIFIRNRIGFKERDPQFDTPFNTGEMEIKERGSQIDSTKERKRTLNLRVPYDTGEVEIDTPGGRQKVRYFTKRGALKICMKSNQPKAVAVQEALIDLYEQVERGQLVSVGYLQDAVRDLKGEIGRLSRLVTSAEGGRDARPTKTVQLVYVPRRCKPRSFDDAVLDFLQKLFNSRPYAKVVELDRQLRGEAVKKGWKVGSTDSVYRAVAALRGAATGLIQ